MPYPYSYNPYSYTPTFSPNVPNYAPPQLAQQNSSGIVWVQGEAGAKSYNVAPNSSVLLMDSEGQRFFLKSADASGMPMPLRVFKFEEIVNAPMTAQNGAEAKKIETAPEYVTREEFERRLKEVACKSTKEVTEDERII